MRTVDQYKSWLLPVFKRNHNWRAFVESVIDEIIGLQKTNMGSYNAVGFSTDPDPVDFSVEGQWQNIFWGGSNLSKGYYNYSTTGGFTQDHAASELNYDNQSMSYDVGSVFSYPFVLGKRYNIKCVITDASGPITTDLRIGIGSESADVELSLTGDTVVDFNLEAADNYLYFKFSPYTSELVVFTIKDLVITGIEEEDDDSERWLLIKKHLDYDEADRYILERMRDSRSFPSVSNLPLEVLRSFLKNYNEFIATQGSGLGELIFFYFLGFSAEVLDLYAHSGDYEGYYYPYLQQKKDDLLISSSPPYYGQVLNSLDARSYIDLKPGHQIGVGDRLSNQNNPWSPSTVKVILLEGDRVYIDRPITSYANDILDVYRVYNYAVNPEPNDYFKTAHVDVYFKVKYIESVAIDFAFLEESFYKYVPINTVIRFFGYNDEIPEQEFSLIEASFGFSYGKAADLVFSETPVYPPDDITYVVYSPTPVTVRDIQGTNVDGFSYALYYIHPTDFKLHTYIRI